jgi:hypothetical protein
MTSLEKILFQFPESKAYFLIRFFLLSVLFLIGIVHWVGFFNNGNWSLVAFDWYKESIYLDSLREALISGMIPWEWQTPNMVGTQYVLAYPVIPLTPDIIFLRWVPNSIFVIIHVTLFYLAGFLGSLVIARQLKASLVTFVFFWLVFNFNGYLIAHLAVGHFEWTGYFLLPFFFILLAKVLRRSPSPFSQNLALVLSIALVLGVLFLNGSFHLAIWCVLFMLITLIWRTAMFANVVVAILIGSLLGLSRWLPTILYFQQDRPFIPGYASFSSLLDAFTVLYGHETRRWWEYDIYVGFVAFVILVLCFVIAIRQKERVYEPPFYLAAGVLFLFSLGNVFAIIANNPLPIPDIERVPSRFIVMSFLVLLITALSGMEMLIRSRPKMSRVPLLLAFPFIAYELADHSRTWRLARLNRSFTEVIPPASSIGPTTDRMYTLIAYGSWAISLIVFVVVVAYLIWHLPAVQRRFNLGRGNEPVDRQQ